MTRLSVEEVGAWQGKEMRSPRPPVKGSGPVLARAIPPPPSLAYLPGGPGWLSAPLPSGESRAGGRRPSRQPSPPSRRWRLRFEEAVSRQDAKGSRGGCADWLPPEPAARRDWPAESEGGRRIEDAIGPRGGTLYLSLRSTSEKRDGGLVGVGGKSLSGIGSFGDQPLEGR